ncbi:hypothetical protein PV11_01923 [Exophiala sideris]|uniref:Uncharacterized protein n=1 Tax=Exophiala sideris TaxID=1016849 RepID=A0A0D1WC14_9EURO|nr:hypothetical protein PV11_01923 [Exophiala sideris]
MAGLSTPAPRQPPAKQMSSRLLNMKFMQRASVSTTSTPAASKTSTPATEPLAKRRRVESETHSPSTSTPDTPYTPTASSQTSDAQVTAFGLSRGGISTFNRGEGADTEWVLDLKMRVPKTDSQQQSRTNGTNGRFDALEDDDGEADEDDEDIWSHQPPGRQAYGSFKGKRRSRLQQSQAADDEDPDSPSEASEDDEQNTSTRQTPSQKRQKNNSKDADSDEEMLQVRRAMEAKHGRMTATTPRTGGGGARLPISGGHPGGGGGHKRSREDGNYKMRKKSRKTI